MEHHLPPLISDLAIILGAGIIVALIFKKIKQPLVLGYIVAGFLVGPYVTFLPTVSERESIKIWAEIGVIFLLFSLGLEFSFKKLLQVGPAASITALVEIVFIMLLGYEAGILMGWNTMNSIFLGGLLASSSTTIILKAFDELGIKRKKYAQVVFGVLIVEDIVVILLMVLLSTMAVSQNFSGGDMLFSFLKLMFFLTLWFILGIFLIPTILRYLKKMIDEEILLILSISLCLGMVVLAKKVGFSAELGAFVMGSILAETISANKIEHSLKPVKDMFGAIFFVSIGMMIDPASIYEYRWEILIVTLITIFGKLFSTSLGAVISGQPLKQSIQVGMSMAQIGEFAFIVAGLGVSLGVTGDFLFPIAVGVSIITTFTTPYMIKQSESFYVIVEKYTPKKIIRSIDNYSRGSVNIKEESKWKQLTKSILMLIFTNGIVVIGIILIVLYVLLPFLQGRTENQVTARTISLVVNLIVSAPFLWAILVKKPESGVFGAIWNENIYYRGPLIVLELSRVLVVVFLLGIIINSIYPGTGVIIPIIIISIFIIFLYLLSTKFKLFYALIQRKFLFNYNERELREKERDLKSKLTKNRKKRLLPWDNHLSKFEVDPNAIYVGKTILELDWQGEYGINIAYIKRGGKVIKLPTSQNMVFPFDEIGILGTDNQIKEFEKTVLEREYDDPSIDIEQEVDDIELTKFVVEENSFLIGKTISSFLESIHGMVVGIERNNERILNPSIDTTFMEEDLVWIVGGKKEIQNFIRNK